ncbi:DUF805 domain-containing protein [Roseateles sp. UC29_93]|uniref:DUF805 domain-containing protein n=1 Tax=Roseateles sp. UC29_93 TaxID=3350177 RepID=UPI00366BA5AD
MPSTHAAWRELSTAGTLTRGGFWLRHGTLVPLALWIAIAVADTPLGWVAALATTVLLISIWGRRLHDRGRSAWWLLLAALPVLGPLLLCVECGLRRSVPEGRRFDAQRPADYLTVAP